MKISSLFISNFRGIATLHAENLGDTIIVAGQNGSGKSCIFDAIRLLKSVYGGYQQNEFQHFFTEFQIQLQGGGQQLRRLLNDGEHSLVIRANFNLRDRERAYLIDNASTLIEETVWQTVLPEAFQYGGYRQALFAAQFRDRQPEVTLKTQAILPLYISELAAPEFSGQVLIQPNGSIEILPSNVLSVIFTTYRPRDIGVIDYHGAQRHYNRESVQGINLNLDQANQARSASSLYNYNAKYNNVKSEMAGNFIKVLLATEAGATLDADEESLLETMKELFKSFFPEKEFLGPRPRKDGTLSFPVRTQNGTEHDLDELSSGEKEILYGYLRIRSSAPRDSIILLDEPELHLNPRLIRGLPEFYRLHLGKALQNQLWLVTHSDALIREAVGKSDFNVFHMLPCGIDNRGASQLKPLVAVKDLDLALTDLVGDLAAYRPGGKGVIFEGGGDSDFDKTLVGMLFADELRGVNLISGSNKSKVRALHEVLARAYVNGDLPTKFYSVVDKDTDKDERKFDGVTEFIWDVYHIENYLLEPLFVAEVLNSFSLSERMSQTQAFERLSIAARDVVPNLVVHRMKEFANSEIIKHINLNFDPHSTKISVDLRAAIERSADRITKAASEALDKDTLKQKEDSIRKEIEQSFANGSWKRQLPGREILKKFVSNENVPTNYEAFRNQISSRMAACGHKPAGMDLVINTIVAD